MIRLHDLALNNDTKISKVSFNEVEIEVLNYLPITEKAGIVAMAIQESKDEKGIMQRMVADAIFCLFVIVSYSNIGLSDEETENFSETYDRLEKNGIIDLIIGAIPTEEYESLVEAYEDAIATYNAYRNSAAGSIDIFLHEMPAMLAGMEGALDAFDPSKLQELQNILGAVGGSQDAITGLVLGQK